MFMGNAKEGLLEGNGSIFVPFRSSHSHLSLSTTTGLIQRRQNTYFKQFSKVHFCGFKATVNSPGSI